MGQVGVGEDEGGAAGFGLGDGVGEQVLGIGEIGGNDDFAGCGKSTCDSVLREGLDVTWQRCERWLTLVSRGYGGRAVFQHTCRCDGDHSGIGVLRDCHRCEWKCSLGWV